MNENVEIKTVKTRTGVEQLATRILDRERTCPVTAFSCRERQEEPALDPGLAREYEGVIEVFVLANDWVSRQLTECLRDLSGKGDFAPYRGAAGIWWEIPDGSDVPAFDRVFDSAGDYADFHSAKFRRLLRRTDKDKEWVVISKAEQATANEEITRLTTENKKLKEKETRRNRDARKSSSRQRARGGTGRRSDCQPEPVRSIEDEIASWWATNLRAQGTALPAFRVDPEFEPSVKALDLKRGTAVEKSAMSICGLRKRKEHTLRTGAGGNDPDEILPDGTKVWRVAVKEKTANAPRLHYGRRPDGLIILFKVSGHKDVKAR